MSRFYFVVAAAAAFLFRGRDFPYVPRQIFPLLVLISPFPIRIKI